MDELWFPMGLVHVTLNVYGTCLWGSAPQPLGQTDESVYGHLSQPQREAHDPVVCSAAQPQGTHGGLETNDDLSLDVSVGRGQPCVSLGRQTGESRRQKEEDREQDNRQKPKSKITHCAERSSKEEKTTGNEKEIRSHTNSPCKKFRKEGRGGGEGGRKASSTQRHQGDGPPHRLDL